MLAQVKIRKALGNRAFTCALLGITAFSSLPAYSQVVPKDFIQGKASCEQELEERFTVVNSLDGDKKISPDDVNPNYVTENCKMNLGSQLNAAKGHRENDEVKGFALSKDATGARYAGACELTHVAVKKHFEELKKKYLAYCEYVEKASGDLSSCTGVTSKSTVSECMSKLASTEKTLKDKFESINKYLGNAKNALEMYQKNNQDMAKEFDKDRVQLASAVNANPQLVASAGFENRLDDYKAGLMPVVRMNGKGTAADDKGALIAEQYLAQDNLDRYLKSVEEFKVDKHALSDKLAEQEAKLKKLKEDLKSGGNDWTKLAGPAAAVAPAAQNLMPKNNTPAASTASGPGISGAVAAIPAAVALAGAAKSSSGASASAPALPAASAPTTHDTPLTAAAGGGPADTATRGPASDMNALKPTDTPKTELAATGSFAPLGFSSDGSSRMGALKKGTKPTAQNTAPAQPANYANSGFDAGGGMMMSSHGGGSHSGPAPGTEVTNLLGQMKSLFNFDDQGGGGGGEFGGAMPAMSPAGFPAGADGAQPAEAGAVADATYPESGSVDGGEPAAFEQGALADNQPDSLFVRVHKRHRRYVERGLLVVNLGGIR